MTDVDYWRAQLRLALDEVDRAVDQAKPIASFGSAIWEVPAAMNRLRAAAMKAEDTARQLQHAGTRGFR